MSYPVLDEFLPVVIMTWRRQVGTDYMTGKAAIQLPLLPGPTCGSRYFPSS